jgi:protein-S-isoprenylcysteine O-methyltransferase Ste14
MRADDEKFSIVVRILFWVVVLVGGPIAGIYLDSIYFRERLTDIPFHIFTFLVGVSLAIPLFRAASTGGRELARRGRSESLPRLRTDRLVTTGIYSKMRHPMLMGLAMLPIAEALVVGSVSYMLFIAPFISIIVVILSLTYEERECRRKFGEEYDEYASRVPPFCLSGECIRALFFASDS